MYSIPTAVKMSLSLGHLVNLFQRRLAPLFIFIEALLFPWYVSGIVSVWLLCRHTSKPTVISFVLFNLLCQQYLSLFTGIVAFFFTYREFIIGLVKYRLYNFVVDEETRTVTYGFRGEIYKFIIPKMTTPHLRRMLTSVEETRGTTNIDITQLAEPFYGPDHNWHNRTSVPASDHLLTIKYSNRTEEIVMP